MNLKCSNCFYNYNCKGCTPCEHYYTTDDEVSDEVIEYMIEEERIEFRKEFQEYISEYDD